MNTDIAIDRKEKQITTHVQNVGKQKKYSWDGYERTVITVNEKLPYDYELDYHADIATYRRTRERLTEARGDPKVEAMIRDVDYALEWLETGRRPGNKRGIERYAAYQREIPTDIVQKYMNPAPKLELDFTDEQRLQAEFIMSIMSERERQCYEMHYIGLYSLDDIALELNMAKGTVQTYLKRANGKVKEYRKRYIPLLDILVV